MATIKSLNVDALVELFGFLDSRSLKTCCLVCKDWENIIGTSSKLMKKLPLLIEKELEHKTDELQNLKRSYNHMIINRFSMQQRSLLKQLEIFSPSTIELNRIDVSDESLRDFLNANDKLNKLAIKYSDVPRFENPSTLSLLKSLSVIMNSWSILRMFPLSKNIQELKIDVPWDEELNFEKDKKILTAFMTGQEKLETLLIVGNYFPLDNNAMVDAKYNLKQLSVRDGVKGSSIRFKSESNACLIQIMERHKDTLENLEFTMKGENFLEFIMENLKVQRLFITAELLPTNRQVFLETQPNYYLKKLIIGEEITNAEALQGLVRTYPTIKSVIIKKWKPNVINEALITIASTLKGLSYLEIPSLTLNTPNTLMPSLRTLNVKRLDVIENFLAFCLNIPLIETLALKTFEAADFTIENIEVMTSRLPELRHIKFGRDFKLTSEILDIFSNNCPQLRLIEMRNNPANPSSNATHGKIEVVYFAQCFTKHVFKEEQTLWKGSNVFDDEEEVLHAFNFPYDSEDDDYYDDY